MPEKFRGHFEDAGKYLNKYQECENKQSTIRQNFIAYMVTFDTVEIVERCEINANFFQSIQNLGIKMREP